MSSPETKRAQAAELISTLYAEGVRLASDFYAAGLKAEISVPRMRAARADVGLEAVRSPAGYVWRKIAPVERPRTMTCACQRPAPFSFTPFADGEAVACAKCDRAVTPVVMLNAGRDAHRNELEFLEVDAIMRTNGTVPEPPGIRSAADVNADAGWERLAVDLLTRSAA